MFTLDTFLEYLIVAYVMVVAIMVVLYVIEHFEICLKKNNESTNRLEEKPLISEEYENNML